MITGMSAGLFLLTGFIYFLRLIQAWLLHRTLRESIKSGSATAESLVERIDGRERGGQELRGDDRNGLVLIAVGVALVGFALVVNDPEWVRYGIGAALFPLLVGIALVVRHVWLRRSLERKLAV
jgi:hypothetical protein